MDSFHPVGKLGLNVCVRSMTCWNERRGADAALAANGAMTAAQAPIPSDRSADLLEVVWASWIVQAGKHIGLGLPKEFGFSPLCPRTIINAGHLVVKSVVSRIMAYFTVLSRGFPKLS
jgi:hypothetical protein